MNVNMNMFSKVLQKLVDGQDLSSDEMGAVMGEIMTGKLTPAQIGGFLIGLRMKGETVDEIAAAARVMRDLAIRVEVSKEHLIDTCGTGGDAKGTFNVSTACAFVAAAGGARVAKHGNRSVSTRSGSADVLEVAGVTLDLGPEAVAQCIDEVGVGFLFAPKHHSAMKHAVGPRKELGLRTLFNLLGPLTNPADAPRQILGVFGAEWVEPIAHVLAQLGSEHVMVVHSDDGLDEISIGAPTRVAELKDGEVNTWPIIPEELGVSRQDLDSVRVDGPEESLAVIRKALAGEPGPAFDMVALNGGAAIYVAGKASSLAEGVDMARGVLSDGSAATTLESLVALTQRLSDGA